MTNGYLKETVYLTHIGAETLLPRSYVTIPDFAGISFSVIREKSNNVKKKKYSDWGWRKKYREREHDLVNF